MGQFDGLEKNLSKFYLEDSALGESLSSSLSSSFQDSAVGDLLSSSLSSSFQDLGISQVETSSFSIPEVEPYHKLLITPPKGDVVKTTYNIESKSVQIGDENTQYLVEPVASGGEEVAIARNTLKVTIFGVAVTTVGVILTAYLT